MTECLTLGEITLEPFQQELIEYFNSTGVDHILIGDDTGNGKTVSTIAWVHNLYERRGMSGPVLVVAKSEKVWEDHLLKMGVPASDIVVVDRKKRGEFTKELASRCNRSEHRGTGQWFIIHWAGVPLVDYLGKVHFGCIIADEAHRAKNRKAQRTQALKRLKCDYKVAATATPADDKPHDVWSLLNWLYPKEYTSFWRFVDRYVEYEQAYGGYKVFHGPNEDTIEEFRQEIAPFYLARSVELAPMRLVSVNVELTEEQRRIYNQMVEMSLADLGDSGILLAPQQITVLQRLQQFALGSVETHWTTQRKKVVDAEGLHWEEVEKLVVEICEPSPKVDVVERIVLAHMGYLGAPGELGIRECDRDPVLVGTQFVSMAKVIAARLKSAGLVVDLCTGQIGNFQESAARFQAGEIDVIVGTIGTIAESETLTRGNLTILVDRSWKPSDNQQVEGRMRRMTQTREVTIVDVRALDTVDFAKAERVRQKHEWVWQLMGDKAPVIR